MTGPIMLEVVGVPAPQGSKTGIARGGRVQLIEGGSATGRQRHRQWRTLVADTARDIAAQHAPDGPLDGPLHIDLSFRFPMPASRPKAARVAGTAPKITKPDLDKLVRSVLDGLTTGGLIRDDARVASLTASKTEVIGWTGATITITQRRPG